MGSLTAALLTMTSLLVATNLLKTGLLIGILSQAMKLAENYCNVMCPQRKSPRLWKLYSPRSYYVLCISPVVWSFSSTNDKWSLSRKDFKPPSKLGYLNGSPYSLHRFRVQSNLNFHHFFHIHDSCFQSSRRVPMTSRMISGRESIELVVSKPGVIRSTRIHTRRSHGPGTLIYHIHWNL